MRRTRAFDDVFPLDDKQVYAIVSKMARSGSCEVFIDGRLVAASSVRSANPLSVEISEGGRFPRSSSWDKLAFKGDDPPMQWERNWIGVIAEPIDSGSNICHKLRYRHGITEIPAPE